ncbi:hypothetical protein F5Y16DRAFT_398629 [Xylariaceae sp. FL0255]|nr:hypothetical protein F5Y16DRAFT_398629 [Xylariaceae sp. FL0255]
MAQSSRSLEEQLRATKGFSDLKIMCQGVEFTAHRFTVCAHSDVLTAALSGNFSEAISKTINMDFDLDSVKRFLEFLYTGDYHEVPDPALALITSGTAHGERFQNATGRQNTGQLIVWNGEDEEITAAEDSALANHLGNLTINAVDKTAESWICHCRMNCMADYYNVAQLSTISLAKLEKSLRSEWNADSFRTLLLECLDEIGDRDSLRLLGVIAADHYDELAKFRLFEADGTGERLAPFVLTGCMRKLSETQTLWKDAEGRCEELKHELEVKESESTQYSKNLEQCKSLMERAGVLTHVYPTLLSLPLPS